MTNDQTPATPLHHWRKILLAVYVMVLVAVIAWVRVYSA